jgi:hypothetical protein
MIREWRNTACCKGMRADHNSAEEGLSIRRKILLSAAALISAVLLLSVPYPLATETVWVIPVCVSTILSLWLALTGRFFAGFAVACLAGILYAFFLQAFEVRYLYRFPLKDGHMFQSGAYYAYRSLLRDAEWTRLIPAAAGAAFLAALNTVTLFGRLHHGPRADVDGFRARFIRGLSITTLIGALLGLLIGWFRYNVGFVVGIQGMLSGLALGLLAGRFLRRESSGGWTQQRRELLLAAGLCSFLFFELIGIGLSQRSFAPHRWLTGLLSGDLREFIFGYTRYRWHTYLFRPGPLAWVLFNLLDIIFMLFLAMVTLFSRVGSTQSEDTGDAG